MTKILSFNTTDKFIYLMLQNDSEILFEELIEEKNKHSELLIPTIEKVLAQFNLEYKDLDAVSTIRGPGNFMGLRAGISVVKAIKISTDIPVITLNAFELLSYGKEINKNQMVTIKANLKNYYIQNEDEFGVLNYDEIKNKKDIKILTNDEILSELPNAEKIDFNFNNWAKLIYKKYQNKEFNNNIEALYIRPPKITKRKTKR